LTGVPAEVLRPSKLELLLAELLLPYLREDLLVTQVRQVIAHVATKVRAEIANEPKGWLGGAPGGDL
jgi:hypothetical protein